jgi:hypothetical protein
MLDDLPRFATCHGPDGDLRAANVNAEHHRLRAHGAILSQPPSGGGTLGPS